MLSLLQLTRHFAPRTGDTRKPHWIVCGGFM